MRSSPPRTIFTSSVTRSFSLPQQLVDLDQSLPVTSSLPRLSSLRCLTWIFSEAKIIRGDYPSERQLWGSAFDLGKLQEFVLCAVGGLFRQGRVAVGSCHYHSGG